MLPKWVTGVFNAPTKETFLASRRGKSGRRLQVKFVFPQRTLTNHTEINAHLEKHLQILRSYSTQNQFLSTYLNLQMQIDPSTILDEEVDAFAIGAKR